MPVRHVLNTLPTANTAKLPSANTTYNGNGRKSVSENSLDVCLLSYRSNPYSGGQGVYVKYLSRELTRQGHSVDVISGQPYPDLPPNVNLIKLPGLNLFESETIFEDFELSFINNPVELFEWLSVLTGGFPEPFTFGRRLLGFFASNAPNYDVIHDNQSLCYGLKTLIKAGYPVVSTIHHPITIDRKLDLKDAKDYAEWLLIRRWYNFLNMQADVAPELDEIICVSESSRRRAIEDFNVDHRNANVVHNGIDSDQFRPLKNINTKPNRIITTASADVPLKGLKFLLKAIDRLREKYPKIELTVVGELKEDGQTEKLINNLNLAKNVSFHSQISHRKMVELYASAAVAVCPSLYEGFGLPAGEAMACEVPVVSTHGGALPEVLGACGEIVEPGNPEALANGIETFLNHPDYRREQAKKSRRRIEDVFDWEKSARQTSHIYRRAIANADNRR